MPISLIAVDIDGTLLDSHGKIPTTNRDAIREALAANIEIVLVTGRTFHHAKPIAEAISERLVLILNNGALVKRLNGETLAQRPLNRKIAREIVTETRSMRQGAALIFDRNDSRQYLFERIDWSNPNRHHYYTKNKKFMTEIEPLEKALTEDPLQISFNGSVVDMRRLEKYLRSFLIAQHVTITRTEYEDKDFTLLDVTSKNCSKGTALSSWSSMLGVDRSEVMAVGDNLNDRDMLEFAAWPIVMANAVPELKARGWPMTRKHDEGGLADAIRSIALTNS